MNLTNVAAFVDVKDDDKPTIVILSDRKLPTEKWTSEFDLMEAKSTLKFSGVLFWLNKDGEVNRWDMYWNGQQSSVIGTVRFEARLRSRVGTRKSRARSTTVPPEAARMTRSST